MKKIFAFAATIIIVIVVGIFLINSKEEDTEVTKYRTKVGVIYNGKVDDRNWTQSHYEALEECAKILNLDIVYKENVPESNQCVKYMEEMIDDGCKIIICNSFGYGEWEAQVAKEHSDIYFFHATGIEQSHNMATYFGRIYQMRYLSGIVAGMQTQTNQIGYVAAFPIAEVNRGLNAFAIGVKSVNPKASVHVVWTDSWIDEKLTEEATNRLLQKADIDVIAMHTDSLKVLEIAEQKGIWSIGYNVDNSEGFPKTFLTAPIWQWVNFYEPRILECLQGKFQGNHYWEGVESGVVALAPLTDNVKDGIAEMVEKEQKRLQSGTFDVFYGPIKDSEGKIRVGEGESMTDDTMLNAFDWYVEGGVIHE